MIFLLVFGIGECGCFVGVHKKQMCSESMESGWLRLEKKHGSHVFLFF